MTPHLAVLGLALLLLLVGSRFSGLLAAPGDGALQRATLHWMAGMTIFHLQLTVLDLCGLRWSPAVLLISLGLVALLAHRFLPRANERARLPSDLGWGDELALFTLAVFALIALTLWITTPDFVYHWGLKGERFFLSRHVDYAWLSRSWHLESIHPDYPNLLPELYAASSLLAGRFDPPALMLWSALFFAAMLAAAREALGRAGASPFVRQAGVAVLALAVGSFALRQQTAGGADWMLALALLAAIPPLLRPPAPEGDLQIGVAAAFAAASKVEGVALAGFLILAQARRAPGRRWLSWGRLLRLSLPAAAVAIPWYVQVRRHRLFGVLYADRFDWERAEVIFPVMRDIVLGPWHGFALVLLLLPLLALRHQIRPLALAAGGQLLFYLWIYFTSGFDTRFYVASSFPRLLLHLVPAVMVGVLIAPSPGPSPAERERGERREGEEKREPSLGGGGESVPLSRCAGEGLGEGGS